MLQQPDDPLIGRVLSGRYEILSPLGAGGMGRVYRAMQHPLDRLVALKVLDPRYDRTNDPEFEKRFLLEASVTAKLKHPNTVTVHDYGRTDDGIFFIAMELVEGETLQQALLKGGPLPWPRALIMGAQVARSLREAHKLGLVHRDLKPANIMLVPEEAGAEAVKVLDFGLVKDFTLAAGQGEKPAGLTQARMLIGSPLYVSPEQIRNQTDPRSDIYSLGVVLFQAISGRTPFAGDDTFDIIAKHLREKPPPLRDFAAVPADVNQLVMRCLEKSPDARFQNMDELLEAMRRATSSQGLSSVFRDGASGIAPSLLASTTLAPTPPLRSAKVQRAAALPAASADKAPADAAPAPAPRQGPFTRNRLLIAGVGLAAGVLFATAVLTTRDSPPPQRLPPVAPRPAEPSAPKEASPPEPVVFDVTSEPPGAAVLMGGKAVGVTPFSLALARESGQRGDPIRVELGFSRDGYLDATRVAQGLEGPPVRVHQVLTRRSAPAPTPAPARPPAPSPARPLKSQSMRQSNPSQYKANPY